MVNWAELVEERNVWVAHNFPNNKAPVPVETTLGVIEEMGELAHAHLKEMQSIRGDAVKHQADAKDAVGDLTVYLLGVMSFADTVPDPAWAPPTPRVLPTEAYDALLQLSYYVGNLSRRAYTGGTRWTFVINRIVYYLRIYCSLRDWDYDAIVQETWDGVKKRDWIAFPHDGLTA